MEQFLWARRGLLVFRAIVTFVFVTFAIVRFPPSYDKKIYLFDLHNEHLQVSHPSHDTRVKWMAALLPISLSLLLCMPCRGNEFKAGSSPRSRNPLLQVTDVIFSSIWVFVLLFVVMPLTSEFGTDSKPMNFDTHPSWSLYMAMLGPITADLAAIFWARHELKSA